MVLVIQAHPYPDRSRANRALGRAIQGLEGVEVRSLYDLYPDFSIDVAVEQEALLRASTVVWQHPIYWYTAPALLKLWFEKVLLVGWAYGRGGTALHGKQCLWVVTAGADDRGYAPSGEHQHPFGAFVPVVQQTAQFCGMKWLEPLIVKGAHKIAEGELERFAVLYRERLQELVSEERVARGAAVP
jgi:glutathione-regulated potassium-efflux system ancillary protein KefF